MNEELINSNNHTIKAVIISVIVIIGLYIFFEYKYSKLAQENHQKIAEITLLNKTTQPVENKPQNIDVNSVTNALENKLQEVEQKIETINHQQITKNLEDTKNKKILKKLIKKMSKLEIKIAEDSKLLSSEIEEKITELKNTTEFENKTINKMLKTFKSQISVEKLDENNLTNSQKIKNLTKLNKSLLLTVENKNYEKTMMITTKINKHINSEKPANILTNSNNFIVARQKLIDLQKNSLIAE